MVTYGITREMLIWSEITSRVKTLYFNMDECKRLELKKDILNDITEISDDTSTKDLKIKVKSIFLLHDAKVFDQQNLFIITNSIATNFDGVSTMYTLNTKLLNDSLQLLSHIFDESNLELKVELNDYLYTVKGNFLQYITRTVTHTTPLNTLNMIINMAKHLEISDSLIIYKAREDWLIPNAPLTVKYLSVFLLNSIISKSTNKNDEIFEKFTSLLKTKVNIESEHDRSIISRYQIELIKFQMALMIHNNETLKMEDNVCSSLNLKSDVYQSIIENLAIVSKECIAETIGLFKVIVPMVVEEYDISRLIDLCWNEITQLKRSDLYSNALREFIQTFFQKEILINPDYRDKVLSYADLILDQSEKTHGVVFILYTQFNSLIINDKDNLLLDALQPYVIKGLIFGPSLNRDQR